MRAVHIAAFNSILNASPGDVEKVTSIVQQLHTASLLLDDVEDDAVLRRGKPVAHKIFGVPRTINTASYVMLASVQKACADFPNSTDMILRELLELHRGQGLELFWRDTRTCPTEPEYREMVTCKTGGLYRLAVQLLQDASGSQLNLSPLAELLGLIYQIQDDYLNLESEKYADNKGFAEDITEGKYSYPVVHCLRNGNPESVGELESILLQRTNNVELKRHALRILRENGSLDYTVDAIRRHCKEAATLIQETNMADPQPLFRLIESLVEPTLGSN